MKKTYRIYRMKTGDFWVPMDTGTEEIIEECPPIGTLGYPVISKEIPSWKSQSPIPFEDECPNHSSKVYDLDDIRASKSIKDQISKVLKNPMHSIEFFKLPGHKIPIRIRGGYKPDASCQSGIWHMFEQVDGVFHIK